MTCEEVEKNVADMARRMECLHIAANHYASMGSRPEEIIAMAAKMFAFVQKGAQDQA